MGVSYDPIINCIICRVEKKLGCWHYILDDTSLFRDYVYITRWKSLVTNRPVQWNGAHMSVAPRSKWKWIPLDPAGDGEPGKWNWCCQGEEQKTWHTAKVFIKDPSEPPNYTVVKGSMAQRHATPNFGGLVFGAMGLPRLMGAALRHRSFPAVTSPLTFEQWKKPWLVMVYRGL